MFAHVVNTQGYNSFYTVFPDPLRCGKSWEGESDVKRVFPIQIGEAVACRFGLGLAKRGEQKKSSTDYSSKRTGGFPAMAHESAAEHAPWGEW
ncbi:MAG: hypothetical protein VX392_05355 [Verrucomicrobiota bacterium]|nr:hypothetical protein [Verrucomicrobiota bacterium]